MDTNSSYYSDISISGYMELSYYFLSNSILKFSFHTCTNFEHSQIYSTNSQIFELNKFIKFTQVSIYILQKYTHITNSTYKNNNENNYKYYFIIHCNSAVYIDYLINDLKYIITIVKYSTLKRFI